MAVGAAKRGTMAGDASYRQYGMEPVSEEVYLAQRVLTNELEQMPGFFLGTIGCAIYINGNVAAGMALCWSLIRIGYGIVYRGSVGLKYKQVMERIVRFTIPSYFISNTMVMATTIHAVRLLSA